MTRLELTRAPEVSRLVKIQNSLYENAHSEPCELKHLAIQLTQAPNKSTQMFGHPEMVPLPFGACQYLDGLDKAQKNILSCLSYAYFYKTVARSEVLALTANIDVADRVFPQYSEEWMVLFQETQEEMDHIWSFRKLFNSILGDASRTETLNEASYFDNDDSSSQTAPSVTKHAEFNPPKVGPIQWWVDWNDTSWQSRHLYHILYNSKTISECDIPSTVIGSLYLLHRYIANLHLKQSESYLFHDADKHDYNPIALQITHAHASDEARHYTTSLDLGLELFKHSNKSDQEMIRFFLKHLIEGHMRNFYLNFSEIVSLGNAGRMTAPYVIGLRCLEAAKHHPHFQADSIDVMQLARSWNVAKIAQGSSAPVQALRWRYVAKSLERLISSVGIRIDSENTEDGYNRYLAALSAA